MQRERRVGPVLSHQVRTLIGRGNQAYIDNNLTEAIRVMQEVIRIEPRAIPAWTVLAQCYEDKSEPQKALQLRIMAAHLRRDSEEWERLARQSRSDPTSRSELLLLSISSGTWNSTSRHCIVTRNCTTSTLKMWTPFGIERVSPGRWATSEW